MFFKVLTQVIIMMILIIIGVILERTKVLDEKGAGAMTDIVLLIVTPCVIIKSFIRTYDPALLKKLLISFLIAALAHIGFILLGKLLLHDRDKSRERVLQFSLIFSNCGYMSLPLQEALLGNEGVFYGSAYIAIFNVVVWSYGIILMSGDKKYMSPKKLIINPGIIAVAIGLVIFLFSIPVPEILNKPITYMAGLNTPLPMIIIGFHLARSNLIDGLKSIKAIFVMFLRLIIAPLAVLGIAYLCGVRGVMLVSVTISSCAPIAAITTMFSAKFGADTPLSVNLVSLSTVFSIATIPIVVTLAQMIA